MRPKTQSLLETLVNLTPKKDMSLLIESRGNNIISSAIMLIETIEKNYGQVFAEEMEKRLLSSIRNRNIGKFTRGAKKINETGPNKNATI
jgi:hypothetical protein